MISRTDSVVDVMRHTDQAMRIACHEVVLERLQQRLVGDEESVKTLPEASCSIALSYHAHAHVLVLADGVELGAGVDTPMK